MARVTTTDIAKEAGVSQTTVSLVLSGRADISISEITRQRVLEIANKMGYSYPLSRKKAHKPKPKDRLIGLIVPNLFNIFFTNVVAFVEYYASAAGYEVIICDIRRNMELEEEKLNSLIEKKVSGIIVAYTPKDINRLRAISREMPVVILGESPMSCGIQTIGINGYQCGRLMAEHLFGLGHRNIVMLTAPTEQISLTRQRRIDGVRSYLSGKGALKGFYVLEDDQENDNNDDIYEFSMGYRLTKKLLERGIPFSAIICSDMGAPGVYSVIDEAGLKIPREVSVLGIDDIFVSRILSPTLTSMNHHLPERCKLAIGNLIEMIEQRQPLEDGYLVEYSPTLVVRNSTAPCESN